MDCVLGYHLTPFTCGIARFNHVLARELGIPVLSLFAAEASRYGHVLLSIKLSEFTDGDVGRLAGYVERRPAAQRLDLFLHDLADAPLERRLMAAATTVYVGNAKLAELVRPHHPNVVEAWCPGALLGAHPFAETEISIFSFGMAHKMRADRYRRLKEILEATGRSYAIYLSTALHEGTSFEGSFMAASEELDAIFGERVNFLGFLSDAAVLNYLRSCTFFTAFFPEGVRANNTSVQTAMQCGSVVITNVDAYSPPEYRHGVNILDIDRLETLPLDAPTLEDLGAAARQAAVRYGWGALTALLRSAGAGDGLAVPARAAGGARRS
jgi:hypothetical protein